MMFTATVIFLYEMGLIQWVYSIVATDGLAATQKPVLKILVNNFFFYFYQSINKEADQTPDNFYWKY